MLSDEFFDGVPYEDTDNGALLSSRRIFRATTAIEVL
jgi:hypothetical protein